MAAAGADIIVGHGPHVLQPVEELEGTLVAYSLGNFLFDQPFPDTRLGAALRVSLLGGKISGVDAVLTVISQGRVRLADGATETRILARLGVSAPDGFGE
jgi:poly-gamma-glutamate synthesis protein (capsule biosynthesis protein)